MPRWPNRRLIDALANAPLTGAATQELDELCRGRNPGGALQSHRCSNRPALHRRAEFAITGFRNRDLQAKLFDTAPGDDREARRRTHWTSRLIAKLRGHRLIAKVGKSRLYRVTARGIKATPSASANPTSRSISRGPPVPDAETSAIVAIPGGEFYKGLPYAAVGWNSLARGEFRHPIIPSAGRLRHRANCIGKPVRQLLT